MMKCYLKPHTGVNDIRFGMHRDRVHEILGAPFYTKEKTFINAGDTRIPEPAKDGYFENELQISYDDDDGVVFIEFSGKDARHTLVYLDRIAIFETPASQLLEEITAVTQADYDRSDDEIPYAYVFRDIDLAVWRQVLPTDEEAGNADGEDEGKYFRTIGIGIRGYYSEDHEEIPPSDQHG